LCWSCGSGREQKKREVEEKSGEAEKNKRQGSPFFCYGDSLFSYSRPPLFRGRDVLEREGGMNAKWS